MLLLFLLVLLAANYLVGGGLGFLGPDLFYQLLYASESILLLLGTHVKLIDLFYNKLLDLLLHNWRLLFNDLLCFPRLLLDQSTVLSSKLSDKFLDFALFLSLVPLIGEASFDSGTELEADP